MDKQYDYLSRDGLEYYTEKLKICIGNYYYNKDEIDARSEHSAQAFYYPAEQWAELDPILMPGELGIDATNGFMKIGDGIHKWSEMDYAIFPVSLSQRSDNLLLKENDHDLFLGEQAMRKLMLEVIMQYHDDNSALKEFLTDDEYYFITADGYQFTHKSQKA